MYHIFQGETRNLRQKETEKLDSNKKVIKKVSI